MLLKEYRIPFPATLDEYRIGMLYMVDRATGEENDRRKGPQLVKEVRRERYFDQNRGLHGIYTEKICNVRSFLPSFIKVFVPPSKSILVEKAWNSFPNHCFTLYECPFFGDSFQLSIESRYVGNDNGAETNALNLSNDELQQRQVVNLNIASEEHLRMPNDYDVQTFQSEKTGRAVLDSAGVWIRDSNPLMCCYKVCRLHVSTRGLPASRIERWGHLHGLQTAFLRVHRQQLCWIDSWFGLRVGDVDGINDGQGHVSNATRPQLASAVIVEQVAATAASELAAEASAALAFSISDETNPFFA